MNKFKSIRIALSLISALCIAALAGCADSDKDKSSTSGKPEQTQDTTAMLQIPLEFHYNTDDDVNKGNNGNLDAQDPTAPLSNQPEFIPVTDANGETVTEIAEVTNADGETVTEYVNVTDAAGETVTNSSGEPETTVANVTEVVEATEKNPQYTPGSENGYVPYTDSAYAFWADISKGENFVFNGEFVTVSFRIKDTAPDGVYDVNISTADFADLTNGGKNVPCKTVVGGKVFVSESGKPQREFTEADGFSVYGDNIECKQGDTIQYNFYMSNNPGLVGMNFWFEYDRNAMEIVRTKASGEFAKVSGGSSFGKAPDESSAAE